MFDQGFGRLCTGALAMMAAAACAAVAGCGGSSSSSATTTKAQPQQTTQGKQQGTTTSARKAPADASKKLQQAMRNGAKLQQIANACAKSAGHDKAAMTSCLKAHGLQLSSGNTALDSCLQQAGDNVADILACSKKIG
jgi:hypothetical protein